MLALSLLIIMFSGPGQTWLLGQFTNTFLEEFGLSKASFNTGYAIATLLASLPMPFIGAAMDRFGLRNATMLAAVVIFVAAIVTANATGPVMLFTGILLFRFGGQGCLAMISGHALAKWFRERLGSVEGIRHALNGAFISVAPLMIVALISAVGWRPALVVVGVVTAGVIVPLVFFAFRETPASIGQVIDGGLVKRSNSKRSRRGVDGSLKLREAIKLRAFWVVSLTPCICVMASTAMILNLQPMMSEVGVDEERAALMLTVFAGVNVPLQFLMGWLVDRTPSWFTPVVANSALVLACLVLTLRESWPLALTSMALFAFCHGAIWSSNGALLVRFFGLDHQGAIRGMLTNIIVAGSASGPVVVGAFVALTGGYDAALVFFAGLAAVVLGLAVTIRDPKHTDAPPTVEEQVAAAQSDVEWDAEEY
ncbi:MAG: MFS transporter [Planctomycetota bacterium]